MDPLMQEHLADVLLDLPADEDDANSPTSASNTPNGSPTNNTNIASQHGRRSLAPRRESGAIALYSTNMSSINTNSYINSTAPHTPTQRSVSTSGAVGPRNNNSSAVVNVDVRRRKRANNAFRALILQRFDQVPQVHQVALKAASVMGSSFTAEELKAFMPVSQMANDDV